MTHRYASAALLALSLGTLAVPARAEDGPFAAWGSVFRTPDARPGRVEPAAPRSYDRLTTGSVSAPVATESRPEESMSYYQRLVTGAAHGLNR